MTSLSVTPQQLAQGIAATARQAGQDDPIVRGADWQTAVVTAINSDGTVSVGAIRARYVDSYAAPAVGDQIVISQSGIGNWVAHGRLATVTRGWTPFTLSSGWSTHSSYYTPAYRLWGDGTASLCGLALTSNTVTSGSTIATLPAEATPSRQVRVAAQVTPGVFAALTIFTNGSIQIGDFSGTLPSGNKYAEYDVFGRYRLA